MADDISDFLKSNLITWAQWPADNKKTGLTLDELYKFVMAARQLKIPGTCIVYADTGLNKKIKKIEVK